MGTVCPTRDRSDFQDSGLNGRFLFLGLVKGIWQSGFPIDSFSSQARFFAGLPPDPDFRISAEWIRQNGGTARERGVVWLLLMRGCPFLISRMWGYQGRRTQTQHPDVCGIHPAFFAFLWCVRRLRQSFH
jgi:hypothetical protein